MEMVAVGVPGSSRVGFSETLPLPMPSTNANGSSVATYEWDGTSEFPKKFESRLRPGAYSRVGFLGRAESLAGVLRRDAQSMEELGLSFEELAGALAAVLAMRPDGNERFDLQIHMYKGSQACPWTSCKGAIGIGSGFDWRIKNRRTCSELRGPGMIVHLIKEHHFFEGFESPYRVDPRALAELLELLPEAEH